MHVRHALLHRDEVQPEYITQNHDAELYKRHEQHQPFYSTADRFAEIGCTTLNFLQSHIDGHQERYQSDQQSDACDPDQIAIIPIEGWQINSKVRKDRPCRDNPNRHDPPDGCAQESFSLA